MTDTIYIVRTYDVIHGATRDLETAKCLLLDAQRKGRAPERATKINVYGLDEEDLDLFDPTLRPYWRSLLED